MRNVIVILLYVSLVLHGACTRTPDSSQSQTQQPSDSIATHHDYPNLKLQATQLTEATIRGDYATVEKLTYPKLIDIMGGSEAFTIAITEAMKQVESNGMKLESLSVGEPRDFVEVDQQIYAIVPTTMKLRVAEGLLVGDAFLIGISADKGVNWTFVDSTGTSDEAQRKELFPAAANTLRIPERKRAVLQKDPPNKP